MTPTTDRLAADYLDRVRIALASLPLERRDEIVADLREHIDAAVAERPGDEAFLRTVLDRLGDPAAIAAEAREAYPWPQPPPPPRSYALEYFAVFLLTAGSIVFPFAGWTGGVVLAWLSHVFTRGEKVFATLCVPFGWSALLLVRNVNGPATTPLVALVVGAPFAVWVVLVRRIRAHRGEIAL